MTDDDPAIDLCLQKDGIARIFRIVPLQRSHAWFIFGAGRGTVSVTIGPGVHGHDMPALLAGYDVLLCPTVGFENGPTIALEAMAVGTPIIASRIGNLAEIVDDGQNGQLVTPGSIDAWSSVLTAAALDPAMIDRWRRAVRQPRTMDDVTADYLALYAA